LLLNLRGSNCTVQCENVVHPSRPGLRLLAYRHCGGYRPFVCQTISRVEVTQTIPGGSREQNTSEACTLASWWGQSMHGKNRNRSARASLWFGLSAAMACSSLRTARRALGLRPVRRDLPAENPAWFVVLNVAGCPHSPPFNASTKRARCALRKMDNVRAEQIRQLRSNCFDVSHRTKVCNIQNYSI
jgi:hypothetical protein